MSLDGHTKAPNDSNKSGLAGIGCGGRCGLGWGKWVERQWRQLVKTTLRTLVIKGNKEIYPQRMSDEDGMFLEEKY